MKNGRNHVSFSRAWIPTLLLMFSSLLTGGAFAQELSEDKVRSFVQSTKPFQQLISKHRSVVDSIAKKQSSENQYTDFASSIIDGLDDVEGSQLHDDFEDLVHRYGFSDIESWARVGGQVLDARAAIQMEELDPRTQRAMKEQAFPDKLVEHMKNLGEAAGQQQQAEMQKAAERMQAIQEHINRERARASNVSEPTKRLVRPYVEQLDGFMAPPSPPKGEYIEKDGYLIEIEEGGEGEDW